MDQHILSTHSTHVRVKASPFSPVFAPAAPPARTKNVTYPVRVCVCVCGVGVGWGGVLNSRKVVFSCFSFRRNLGGGWRCVARRSGRAAAARRRRQQQPDQGAGGALVRGVTDCTTPSRGLWACFGVPVCVRAARLGLPPSPARPARPAPGSRDQPAPREDCGPGHRGARGARRGHAVRGRRKKEK